MNFAIRTFALSLMLLTSIAIAGEEGHVGNGGNAVVCKSTQDKRFQNQTLLADFVEFNLLYAPNSIEESNASLESQITKALSRVRAVNTETALELEALITAMRDSPRKIRESLKSYPHTEDMGLSDLPGPQNACSLVPVIIFSDEPLNFKIDMKRYRKLSPTHRAGLWMHEALYFLARNYSHAFHSKAIRLINALLFSRNENPEMLKALLDLYVIRKPWMKVEAIKVKNNIIRLKFSRDFP